MNIASLLTLGQTALELGLICSLTVLALFLSYSMLNVCDLSTDGCFTLGAAVGAVVAISGHPWLAILAAIGLKTSFSSLRKAGIRPMIHGFIISALVVIVALVVEVFMGIV